VVAPDDGVGFPVAEPGFAVDDAGAFLNAGARRQLPPAVIRAVAFASYFLAAQVVMECPASLFVRVNVEVDALVADRRLPLQSESPTDLLRAPLSREQALDLPPRLWRDAGRDSLLLPRESQLVSLLRAIAPPPTIAAHLARDGAFMDADLRGDLSSVKSGFHEGVNLVSLLLGELRIVHRVLP